MDNVCVQTILERIKIVEDVKKKGRMIGNEWSKGDYGDDILK